MAPSPVRDEDDTDALLDALEEEDANISYNTQRIAQLKAELSSAKASQSNPSSGGVTTLLNNSPLPTLSNDQAVLDFTTQLAHCIIHFFHPDFARCGVMDRHLTLLSDAHSSTGAARFARVDVRNVPFIVEKLKIRVLPCVIGFIDGEVTERVVGFEGLGPGGLDGLGDDFETGVLEERLVRKRVLSAVKIGRNRPKDDDSCSDERGQEERTRGGKKTIRSSAKKTNDDDSDWD
ncbi:hypothetical protein LOZ58_000805 [Ophidiomyces ophidiicola]|nr:hypothetical protein LOZ65_000700 [Ophidiomyces ophidiicola]KAI1943911.1 hypothetical protein LOZ66_000498 [Ophidiomyces ophidiicola]KAI1965905.1 hypothetical protein LOZ58_000805 [Ophidiomyces ophidiicola]